MESFTLKSGTNKGNRRIWIEGDRLARAGFVKGDRLTRTIDGDTITLAPATDGGKLRIAGTPARPIIDQCGKWVTAFMGDAERFRVTITGKTITITPEVG